MIQFLGSQLLGPTLGNQKLSCWRSSSQSEAAPAGALANQKLLQLGTTGAVTGFCTKPPIMPYFSEYSSILLVNQSLGLTDWQMGMTKMPLIKELKNWIIIKSLFWEGLHNELLDKDG